VFGKLYGGRTILLRIAIWDGLQDLSAHAGNMDALLERCDFWTFRCWLRIWWDSSAHADFALNSLLGRHS